MLILLVLGILLTGGFGSNFPNTSDKLTVDKYVDSKLVLGAAAAAGGTGVVVDEDDWVVNDTGAAEPATGASSN